jgi:hypothetical protein
MRTRVAASVVIVVAALAAGLSAQVVHNPAWSVPRTPDGQPDMQGVWANNGMTPLERPKQFGTRATMTDAELADLKKRAQKLIDGGDAPLKKTGERMFDYACHEGNYGLRAILSGARAQEHATS